jgi:hypothetical protein
MISLKRVNEMRVAKAEMIDAIASASDNVELVISSDRRKIWINVNGVCMFRMQGIDGLVTRDE